MIQEPTTLLVLSLFALSPVAGQASDSTVTKSEGLALAASVAGTVAPVAVGALLIAGTGDPLPGAIPLVAGLVVGPSLGHFYAGNPGHGVTTMALRYAVALVTLVAADCLIEDKCSDNNQHSAQVAAIGGFSLVAAISIYDVATAPASARSHNRQRVSLSVGPARVTGRRALATRVTVCF